MRDITENNLCYAAALFDLQAKDKVEAVYGLSLTLGMVVTIGLSLTMMAMDMQVRSRSEDECGRRPAARGAVNKQPACLT